MKNIALLILSVFAFTFLGTAQDMSNTAKTSAKKEVMSGKESGAFQFTLPSGLKAEDVAKNASYYTRYFSVKYDEKTGVAKIQMITNDDKSRHVIVRFLSACGVQYVDIEGQVMTNEDFFVNYLK